MVVVIVIVVVVVIELVVAIVVMVMEVIKGLVSPRFCATIKFYKNFPPQKKRWVGMCNAATTQFDQKISEATELRQ